MNILLSLLCTLTCNILLSRELAHYPSAESPTQSSVFLDAFAEVPFLTTRTHSILSGKTSDRGACEATMLSWHQLGALLSPRFSYEEFGKQVAENFRRCNFSIPAPRICHILGLKKGEDITPTAITSLNDAVQAADAFKKNKTDEANFGLARDRFLIIYNTLKGSASAELPEVFKGIKHDEFCEFINTPDTAQIPFDHMLSVARQFGYLARETYGFEFYQAFDFGKDVFDNLAENYRCALTSSQLGIEQITKISTALVFAKNGDFSSDEIRDGLASIILPSETQPALLARALTFPSQAVRSLLFAAISQLRRITESTTPTDPASNSQ